MFFSYECKYDELDEWEDFIWKVYLMLRFYTANLLFPQIKIIMDGLTILKLFLWVLIVSMKEIVFLMEDTILFQNF